MPKMLYDEFQIDELVQVSELFDDMMMIDRNNLSKPDLNSGADLFLLEWNDRIETIAEFYRFREGDYS